MLKYIKNYAASIEGIDIYPVISMLIFVLFFTGMLWFVKRMKRDRVDTLRHLPLHDDAPQPVLHS